MRERERLTVATLPCQSGNSAECYEVSGHFSELQLYHAKAETGLTLPTLRGKG